MSIETKRHQDALKESEERWQFALEGSQDGVWDWNAKTNAVFFSRRWKEMLGFEETEIANRLDEWDSRVHPDDRVRVYADLKGHLNGETPYYQNEHRVRCKDDTYKWILDRGKVVEWDAEGEPLRVIGTHTDITERREAQEALAHFKRTLDQTRDCIFMFHPQSLRFHYANQGAIDQVGYSREELLDMTPVDIKPAIDEAMFRDMLSPLLDGSQRSHTFETIHRHKQGRDVPVEILLQYIAPEGQTPRFLAIVRDITQRKRTEAALRASEERFDLAVQGSSDGIWDWNITTNEVYLSPRFKALLGYEKHEMENSFQAWESRLHPDDRDPTMTNLDKHLNSRETFEVDYRLRCKNGAYRWFLARGQAGWNDEGNAVRMAGSLTDTTFRKEAETRIERLAYYDELTGLPNRRLLLERLNQELASANRHEHRGALLFLDLDDFKKINDSLGHPAGDALLQQVASRLIAQVRTEDTVARLGGDEFVVLQTYLNESAKSAAPQSHTLAERLRASLARPYQLLGYDYHVTSSIGVVLFPDASDTSDDLLKHADTAMYQSKRAGRNAIHHYRPSMQAAVDSRLAIEKDLRLAIDRRELSLQFQPEVEIASGDIIGAEALLRWTHATRGPVPPAEFIPIAEETGVILNIGEWVLVQTLVLP